MSCEPIPGVANSLRAQSFKGKLVGNGQCVTFVHGAVNIQPASLWHQGVLVKGDPSLAIGTVIATFDADGRYGNHVNGTSHAAIYTGQNGMGIQVLDQWNGHRGSHPVGERAILFREYEDKADDGDASHVVD